MSDHHSVVEFQDEPNTGLSWVVIVLTVVFLTLIVLGGLVFYRGAQSDALNTRELLGQPTAELRSLRQTEAEALQSLRWIDKSKGSVQIPIEMAMDSVRQHYQNR